MRSIVCFYVLLIFWILKQYKNYKMLYTELIITFQSCRDVFQTLSLAILSLYDFLLRSYITGKLCTQSIIFFIKFLFAAHGIQKHNCREQATTLPVCCYKTSASSRRSQGEVKDRMPQPHDAAASAQCQSGSLMSATLKTSPLQNHSFDFCVPHHAYASVTAWLLKTKFCRVSSVC